MSAEVRFAALKNGKTIWADQPLHSGGPPDLSFELGYPDHRWVSENVLQFYNRANLNDGKSQSITVANGTGRTIKFLKIECWDKFLLFDIAPFSEVGLVASPPKGDHAWFDLIGEFEDGAR